MGPRRLGLAALIAACAILLGCANAKPAAAPAPTTQVDAEGNITIDKAAFDDWRRAFRHKALDAGVSGKIFDRALGNITPNPDILQRDQAQPESAQAIWEYIDNATAPKRIDAGRQKRADNQATISKIEKEYGVDGQYLVSIWGLESNFGTIVGKFNLFESLATLAYEGRRKGFAETELIAALKIVQRGDEPPERMVGSWAGAVGQTQFIPSAYLAYAVDEDGDGRRDLFDSVPDVLASIANFLVKSGWKPGEDWGEEVKLPPTFDYALADPTIRLPLARWRELGVTKLNGKQLKIEPDEAALFLPAGHKGPAFITLDNFRVFLRYNNSTSYALGVGALADRLGGGGPIKTGWPREERPLTLTERIELQTLLNQLGYSVGTPDGIVGAGTRSSLRAYQNKIGLPADGFATVSVLERLRKDAGVTAGQIISDPRGLASSPAPGITPMQPIPNPD